tara:strand:+ start:231 stop:854 length:624 start_codon:yes stop_codon:yes gene_type:complete
MCGRYVVTKAPEKTKNLVKSITNVNDDQNFNAHPGQILPVIKSYSNGKTLEQLKWGIIPSWAKQKDFRPLINARLETIDEKVSFKKLIQSTRCIAVMDGFYEWKRTKENKTPYYFTREDNTPLFVAGIFDKDQFCLITEEANSNIIEIHHRQPVILDSIEIDKYLDLKKPGKEQLLNIKRPNLKFHEISKEVNKPTNNDPALINPIL